MNQNPITVTDRDGLLTVVRPTGLPAGAIPAVPLDHFVTEASDLGLRPGHWPYAITVKSADGSKFGNGMPFMRDPKPETREGEIVSVGYRQEFGIFKITVFND